MARLFRKGVSTFNDLKGEVEKVSNDNETISRVFQHWFQVTHPIDQFWRSQNPTPEHLLAVSVVQILTTSTSLSGIATAALESILLTGLWSSAR